MSAERKLLVVAVIVGLYQLGTVIGHVLAQLTLQTQ